MARAMRSIPCSLSGRERATAAADRHEAHRWVAEVQRWLPPAYPGGRAFSLNLSSAQI